MLKTIPSLKALEAQFHKLRDQYLLLAAEREKLRLSLAVRHGDVQWASDSSKKKLSRLYERKAKIGDKIFEILESVSPRNWSAGVPVHWICEKLSWQDAIAPLDQPLSVSPPLAYGTSSPMR